MASNLNDDPLHQWMQTAFKAACELIWSLETIIYKWWVTKAVLAFVLSGVLTNLISGYISQPQDGLKVASFLWYWRVPIITYSLLIALLQTIIFFVGKKQAINQSNTLTSQSNISAGTTKILPKWLLILVFIGAIVGITFKVMSPAILQLYNYSPRQLSPTLILSDISDGNQAFDTERLDGIYKNAAVNAMKEGNPSKANAYWTWAADDDTADAEPKIYVEDQCIQGIGHTNPFTGQYCNIKKPRETLIVAAPLSGSPDDINRGRDILQGAYLTQIEYNMLHSNGPQLYLQIADVGDTSATGDMQKQAAKQMHQLIDKDKTVVGITGWIPESSDQIEELPPDQIHLPIISITPLEAAYNSANFLSVSPSFGDEAAAAIDYINSKLHANNIAVVYPEEGSAYKLSRSFLTQKGTLQTTQIGYSSGNDLSDAISRITTGGYDLVYFTGPFADIESLHTALERAGNTIPIVGSDITYQWIHASSDDIGNFIGLSFTASAFPDEWGIQRVPVDQSPFYNTSYGNNLPMTVDYKNAFDPTKHFNNSYIYDRADSDAILGYDATALLATAICKTLGNDCGNTQKAPAFTADQLWNSIHDLTSVGHTTTGHPFQGISGQISFSLDSSSPFEKAVLALSIQGRGTQSIAVYSGKYS